MLIKSNTRNITQQALSHAVASKSDDLALITELFEVAIKEEYSFREELLEKYSATNRASATSEVSDPEINNFLLKLEQAINNETDQTE